MKKSKNRHQDHADIVSQYFQNTYICKVIFKITPDGKDY